MRNLKRALSLALASVMLLGMMVVGSSAASYPDVDDNDNVEAIEVLNAVKVMIGDHGSFNPDKAVNRHEMAVIMAKLVLGNEAADNYVGSHPFTDVYPWADKYVAACYENGLVSGTSATTYGGNQPLTAVQAAAMMLRALGYKDLSKGATDWRAPVTAMANQIRLFSGVASNPKEQLTRNQVAQLALNTLKSPVVDLKDGTFDISSGDGQVVITGGQREYIVRSSYEAYARAINRTETAGTSASGVSGYTVELGEHLYNGKLRLEDSTDVFGRPSREWIYDGKEIGTYAKDEMLRKEYTSKVTGKMLYEQLGSSIVNGSDWDLFVSIDGDDTNDPALFGKSDLTRSNTNAVGATEKGVLTQVFVDSGNKEVYIAIINTFLAIASEDYDEKNGEVDLKAYALNVASGELIKDRGVACSSAITVTVEDEDIDVSGVKEDDMFLITVADGKVQTMSAPEVLADRKISSFKLTSDVVSDGKTYEYAHTAKYDDEVLDDYSQTNMKNTTYNIVLDKYGYLIGIEANSDPDQYLFITGMNGNTSDLATKNADANVIFLDGTMKTVNVNVEKSTLPTSGPQMNTWCTYSVDKDVYTLKQVATATTGSPKVMQSTQDVTGSNKVEINTKNVALKGIGGTTNVYGNDDTIYLNVKTDVIKAATEVTASSGNYYHVIINDVDTRIVGARNANLEITNQTAASGDDGSTPAKAKTIGEEIYPLYKDNGYIIAAVTIGEEDGVSKTYAYVHTDKVERETINSAEDEWTWTRKAIVDGKETVLREVGGGTDLSVLKDMQQGYWYELKLDADGNVKSTNPKGSAGNWAVELTFAANSGAAGSRVISQYVNTVVDAVESNQTKDTVILQAAGMDVANSDKLTYNNAGTLYTDQAQTEGFSVSPSVKVVLCDDDYSIEREYSGRSGLTSAIANLDSNFTGELNVVFDKGDAVVIILVDTTGGGATPPTPPTPPAGGYSSVVDTTIDAANLPAALKLTNSTVSDANDKLTLHYVDAENKVTQIKEALTANGFTDIGEITLSSGTYSIPCKDADGLKRTVTCALSDGTAYYTVTVDGTLVEYVAKNGTSNTVSPVAATGTNPTGFIKTVDGGTSYTYTAYDGITAYATSTSADVEIKTGYYKITGVADVTTAAVIAGDASATTVGKYKIESTVDAKGVKISNDFAVKADATITIKVTYDNTAITGTNGDSVVVAMTASKGVVTGSPMAFGTATTANTAKTVTITTFTGDDAYTIKGSNS